MSWIPPLLQPKRQSIEECREIFSAKREALLAASPGRMLSDEQLRQLRELDAQEDQALNLVVSPQEREELDIRNSDQAADLRDSLGEIEVTEQEFRTLFRLRKELDSQIGEQTEEAMPVVIAAGQRYTASVRALLGEDRCAALARAHAPQ